MTPKNSDTQSFRELPVPEQTVEQDLGLRPPSISISNSNTITMDEEPEYYGRYKVMRRLGSGGFGVVHLGFDDILERVVAIKVPRFERINKPEQIEAYLGEAKLVANLEHPAIIRVYDCGHTADNHCYVVSQYIDGGDLSEWLKSNRAEQGWAADLVMRVAEALHHAHKQRIVHRDVKPANILLDGAGTPFLGDFGLAMREQDFGRGSGYAGTPRYMSPEQARGEGHRVDGRSDIYSLGVVLYELLSGRVPFVAESITDLLEQIQVREPPPLRLSIESLPPQLERIVMKSLAKRAADRYSTAAEFADDLRHWREDSRRTPAAITMVAPQGGETPGSGVPHQAETRPPRVVPKGLRAFDANDADFFLKLVPGPRDRDGLPETIRFWKSRLENRAESFAVGLLYGPSGCGKSSFVRAGLLPRLSNSITAIYLEATPADTESKLLQALQRHRSDLAPIATLAEMLTQLRRTPQGPILLVIDQFEQWLAAHADAEQTELAAALRQCDGTTIQTLLLVRDDFWMAATRFFRALEIPLQEGTNSAAVDLFDADHARKVLAGFGRAFGKLPAKRTEYSASQNLFLDRSVAGLANAEGRIVCVRLALFAEMVKGKPWEPSTLSALGGLDGVGVAFLDDTFGRTAPPTHRYHEVAARSVLAALLPPVGTEIKTTMAPREALLEASGYAQRPEDFDALMAILDSELRLVTPAESENGNHYQLTHDYLVPSLREWLTRKQKETKRGRAELLLAERVSLWQPKQDPRQLPSLGEWYRIRTATNPQFWKEPERRMMRKAARYQGGRVAFVATVLVIMLGSLAAYITYVGRRSAQDQAVQLVQQIATANPYQLPSLVERVRTNRERIDPLLDEQIAQREDRREKLQLQLARDADDPFRLTELLTGLPPDDPLRVAGMMVLTQRLNDPDTAVALLLTEPDARVGNILNKLKQLDGAATALAKRVAEIEAGPESADRERTVARLKNAMLVVNASEPFWAVLGSEKDRARNAPLIHDAKTVAAEPTAYFKGYCRETAVSARRAALLILGQNVEKPLAEMLPRLLADYGTEPDAGVHAALDWLLRRWGQEKEIAKIIGELRGRQAAGRGWEVNKSGQTLTLFSKPLYEFEMGALPKESDRKADSNRHLRRIARPFAMSSREITVQELLAVLPEYRKEWDRNKRTLPKADCPATSMSWIEAAQYCNALSEADGIAPEQWCYEIESLDGQKPTLQLKPNATSLLGYRLPTETEWEFAARAGCGLIRHFGNSETLLANYAWYKANGDDQAHPVGRLMPNEFGLFDMLGNASEWLLTAHDSKLGDYPADGSLVEDRLNFADYDLNPDVHRGHRGGAFYDPPIDVRSARRFAMNPWERYASLGFRVVRTLAVKE